MTKDEFLAIGQDPWWLLQKDLVFQIETLRVELGKTRGWDDPLWYTDQNKLEELFRLIDQNGPTFFAELEQATDDDRRSRWLESLIDYLRPPDTEGGGHGGAPAAAAAGGSAPTEEAVKSLISGLSSDDVSRLADELGVSPEQVEALMRDPDLEKLVTEEAARLARGGA